MEYVIIIVFHQTPCCFCSWCWWWWEWMGKTFWVYERVCRRVWRKRVTDTTQTYIHRRTGIEPHFLSFDDLILCTVYITSENTVLLARFCTHNDNHTRRCNDTYHFHSMPIQRNESSVATTTTTTNAIVLISQYAAVVAPTKEIWIYSVWTKSGLNPLKMRTGWLLSQWRWIITAFSCLNMWLAIVYQFST